jgi:hypothetical protein
MNNNWRDEVIKCIENEGFDYTFTKYSVFEDVKDLQFHLLRNAYLDAAQNLADYIGIDIW